MAPTDLTVQILRQIRDELKAQRDEMKAQRIEFTKRFEHNDERMSLIEATLVDTNGHLLVMSRSLKALLSSRGQVDRRLDDHEVRLARLEKRKPH